MQFLKTVFHSGALQIWFLIRALPEFTLSRLPMLPGIVQPTTSIPVVSDLDDTWHSCHLPALDTPPPRSVGFVWLSQQCSGTRSLCSEPSGCRRSHQSVRLRSCIIARSLSSSSMVSFEPRGVQATTAVQVDLLVWSAGGEDPRFWASRTRSHICPGEKSRTPLFLPPALRAPRHPRTRTQVSRVSLGPR